MKIKVRDIIGSLFGEPFLYGATGLILKSNSKEYLDLKEYDLDEEETTFDEVDLPNNLKVITLNEKGEELLKDYIDEFLTSTGKEETYESLYNDSMVYMHESVERLNKVKDSLVSNKKKMIMFNTNDDKISKLVPTTDIFCPSFRLNIFEDKLKDELFKDLYVMDNNENEYPFNEFVTEYSKSPISFSKEVNPTVQGLIIKVFRK